MQYRVLVDKEIIMIYVISLMNRQFPTFLSGFSHKISKIVPTLAYRAITRLTANIYLETNFFETETMSKLPVQL